MDEVTRAALEAAATAAPHDVGLRVQLARAFLAAGLVSDAWRHAAAALQQAPTDPDVRALVDELNAPPPPPEEAERVPSTSPDELAAFDAEFERPQVSLADVAGLEDVKRRLNLVVFAPLRNPEVAAAFDRTSSGGMLLWGPPGCGKTFIAKAVAGELDISFTSVGLDQVLDMWLGNSERNVAKIFDEARRMRPCVLFLDELDALGLRRTRLHNASQRGVVNTLLVQLDGVDSDNAGLFVMGATNQPWDIDPALRRPGRLDRTVFVPPPDAEARMAILAERLALRPLGDVDLRPIVEASRGFSAADIRHLAETAIDLAFEQSLDDGGVVPVLQRHLLAALREVRPSIADWLAVAETAAMASDDDSLFGPFVEWRDRRTD